MYDIDSSGFFEAPSLSITESYSELALVESSREGFAQLYRAVKDGKQFILKALKEEFRDNPIYEELLRKEYELGFSLDHINIRRTYSFSRIEPLGSVIVMEYVVGRTLREYIAEEHTAKERMVIVEELCSALAFAHKGQIIHRDLKPENIIITRNGDNVKVIDFGLADSDSHVSLKGAAGSMRYASPELLQGRTVDNRSDIYSIGVILAELMPSQRASKRIAERCTRYNPAKRYGSAQEIIAALHPRGDKYIYRYIYFMVLALLLGATYIIYRQSHQQDQIQQISASLTPSAAVDGVSKAEFAERKEVSDQIVAHMNSRYAVLVDSICHIGPWAERWPDFDSISESYLSYYRKAIEREFASMKSSSLYSAALRNSTSHNSEVISLAHNQFPSAFWINAEAQFFEASDSLALLLKAATIAPEYPSNFSDLSYDEQQAENRRYNNCVLQYKIATVQKWVVEHRNARSLSELPASVVSYYQSQITL